MKKPISILVLLLLIFTTLLACSDKENPSKAIEDGAQKFIDKQISIQNEPAVYKHGFRIIDSKITKLERIAVFDDIIDYQIELWNLEYKLKPNDNTEHAIERGTIIEDGWITEDNGMGKSCLIFKIDGDEAILLDSSQAEEFDFERLSKLEISVRDSLTHKGLLPNGAYEGNHIIIKFPVSKDSYAELFMSQPVIQGENGIWAVEKWKQEDGHIQNVYPGIDARRTDISIGEKYQELQNKFTSGEDLSLADPIEVAMDYIKYRLRQHHLKQIQVEIEDLEIIDPATIEDFE